MASIVVVGASLGGLRTVEFLRRAGFEGSLVLIGDELHLPYDRPPLSKEILRGEWEPDRIMLRRKSYDELDLQLELGVSAVKLNTNSRTVLLDNAKVVDFDRLVIATGGSAKRLVGPTILPGVFTLRGLDDALALRDALQASSRVVVVGAGFIGAEVAASARQLGLEVAVVETQQAPLELNLGSELGHVLSRVHEKRGVRMYCGRRVVSFHGSERVTGVTLDDGTRLRADVVVVGIGIEPAVSWLQGSGLVLDNGVFCDEKCQSSMEGIFAIGDVANWYNPLFEEHMRVEHWTHVVEQARHVAQALIAPNESKPFASAPLFWSDQYDIKIQGAGSPKPEDDIHICAGRAEDEKFVALYSRQGRLVGAVSFNHTGKLMRLRSLIAERGTLEDAIDLCAS